MSIEYSYAGEAEEIARDLIPVHHGHLINARIEYVFRSEHASKGDKPVLGKARKVGSLNAFLAKGDEESFFVMEIAADTWKELEAHQRKALVDHELCHFWVGEDDGKLQILPHDLEEFTAVVKRHGLWSPDVTTFTRVTSQMELPLSAQDEDEEVDN